MFDCSGTTDTTLFPVGSSTNFVTTSSYARGATTINVNGTGTILTGDYIMFAGDYNVYLVTAGTSGSGNIMIWTQDTGILPTAGIAKGSGVTILANHGIFNKLHYKFNFGDPGSGKWGDKTTGSSGTGYNTSRNYATGPISAHVFDTGSTASTTTFHVTAQATNANGETSSVEMPITVYGTEDVTNGWGTGKTFCVYNNTPFGSCPGGGTEHNYSDFYSAMTAAFAESAKRILFNRGQTFTSTVRSSITADGPGYLGAYGSGAPPIIQQLAGTKDLLAIGTSTSVKPYISDWRIVDLNFQGPSTYTAGINTRGIVAGGGITKALIYQVSMSNLISDIMFDINVLDFAAATKPNIVMYDQIAIVDSTLKTYVNDKLGYKIYASATHFAAMGNAMGDINNLTGSHIMRDHLIDTGVFEHNSFIRSVGGLSMKLHGPSWCDSVLSTGSGYSGTCYFSDNTTPPSTTTYRDDLHPMRAAAALDGYTQKVVVSDNYYYGGGSPTLINAGPQNVNGDERLRHIIFERNFFDLESSHNVQPAILQGSWQTARNNVELINAGAPASGSFGVGKYGDASPQPPVDTVDISNNTIFKNITTTDETRPLLASIDYSATSTSAHVTIENNLVYAPHYTNVTIISGTGSPTYPVSASNNSTNVQANSAASSPFVVKTPSLLKEFRTVTNAYPRTAGRVSFPASYDDLFHCYDWNSIDGYSYRIGAAVPSSKAICSDVP